MIPNFIFIDEVHNIKNNIAKILKRLPYCKKRKRTKLQIITDLTTHFPYWSSTNHAPNMYSNPIANKECQDIYVGEINNGAIFAWFGSREREMLINYNNPNLLTPKTKKDNYKTIVIILESPHTNEYNQNYTGPIPIPSPALGKTGENLQIHKDSLFSTIANQNSAIFSGSYRIILMESISYQCSLGEVNGKKKLNNEIRDLIFNEIWNQNNTRLDFYNRLESYKPAFILNFCTGGEKKNSLRKSVQNLIDIYKNQYPLTELYYGNHPSLWKNESNRKTWHRDHPNNPLGF